MNDKTTKQDQTPGSLIAAKIETLNDWRGKTLTHVRALISQAAPNVVEDIKWRKPSNPNGVPTWCHDGIICTGETYKDKVKLTFMKGAQLNDPCKIFNSGINGKTRRAIDIKEGDEINAEGFKQLIREAVALNSG
ncbi:DUF1801 domain-containing protein [Microbulbifer epialgicus]|uniref:DUF1801 domain-containing protein n=1 Tax=Microbulbifer epialgicus TaxID=393907 RepID=A0ABV4P4S4_9GAMM